MNNFSINNRTEQDIHILELNGELDAHTAPILEENITTLIEQSQFRIIVNCTGLDYISSAGLGVFMAYIEEVRNLGGDIKLTNMKPTVYNVFDLLGFPTLYDILDEEAQAIGMFNSNND